MIEVIYCMRRKEGLSLEAFLAHWEGVHVPIVMRNLPALRLAGYERVLGLPHPFGARVERASHMSAPFDGVARLRWASQEDMRHAFESAQGLAVQRELAKDEAHFVDAASSCRWIAQSVVHVSLSTDLESKHR